MSFKSFAGSEHTHHEPDVKSGTQRGLQKNAVLDGLMQHTPGGFLSDVDSHQWYGYSVSKRASGEILSLCAQVVDSLQRVDHPSSAT